MASKTGAAQKQPISEHVGELRRRLFYCVGTVMLGASAGYIFSDQVLYWLQHPLHEKLYYTSPTGAFSFIMKISLVFGIVVALPMIIYQVMGFLRPVMGKVTTRTILATAACSMFMAVFGVAFAYFFSLPSALKFLTNFHSGDQALGSLITVNEYFNFVMVYLVGAALLFQTPIILAIINRIKPLKPKKLLGIERYVILASFIVAAMLTPTPDPVNQMIMALPMVLMYQFGVAWVWLINRRKRKRQAPTKLIDPFRLSIPDEALGAELDNPLPAWERQATAQLSSPDTLAKRVQPVAQAVPAQVALPSAPVKPIAIVKPTTIAAKPAITPPAPHNSSQAKPNSGGLPMSRYRGVGYARQPVSYQTRPARGGLISDFS